MTSSHGMVLGKFYPPHAGHSLLISRALAECDRVTVVLLGNSSESIPVQLRHEWLEEMHPDARIVSGTADHVIDYDDPAVWDLWMREIRGLCPEPVDAVFSSEQYGDELARRLDARHVSVDPVRAALPVSGTSVRANPAACWQHLAPCVRAWFVQRYCVVGAESTGTTTMTRALAEHYGTIWVPEYGREYTYDKRAKEGSQSAWRSEEFLHVARRQDELEDAAARACPVPLLFCDTDSLATAIWHERYMGFPRDDLWHAARPERYTTYLLTLPDIPFEDDGWRDGEHLREWMTDRFRTELSTRAGAFTELAGSHEHRLATAIAVVEANVGAPIVS